MRDVARAAGVSVETVYAGFRSKGDLLLAAIDVAVVGDIAPVPLDQRPEFAALGSGTRRHRARVTARLVTGINQRTAGVILALREAAASDAELAQRMREREQRRRINVEQGAALVAGATAPAPGARFRGRNRSGRLRWSRVCEILAVDPPHQIAWRTIPTLLFVDSSDWRITLDQAGAGTRIVQTFQVTKCPRWWEWIVARANPRHIDRSAALTEDLHRLAYRALLHDG